jgi:hypothetical protein
VKQRPRIASILAVGLTASVLLAAHAVGGTEPSASPAKKCKKRSAHRAKRCRRRHPAALSISPPGHDFGTIGLADSPPIDFVVTNTGGRASGIPSTSVSGLGSSYFRIEGTTCTTPLAPRATCAVTVRSAGNNGGTGIANLNAGATPGGTASAVLVVNLY